MNRHILSLDIHKFTLKRITANGIQNMSLTLETLKNQYYTYFKKVHDYTIVGKIEIGKIQKKDSLQRSFVTYHYTEKVDDKRTNAEAILIINSEDYGKTWDILDMKFLIRLQPT